MSKSQLDALKQVELANKAAIKGLEDTINQHVAPLIKKANEKMERLEKEVKELNEENNVLRAKNQALEAEVQLAYDQLRDFMFSQNKRERII